jgi:deoxyribodipyrimidine photolyase
MRACASCGDGLDAQSRAHARRVVLVKNLRIHWLQGARWFWDTLVDADLPNNTMNWQWVAVRARTRRRTSASSIR